MDQPPAPAKKPAPVETGIRIVVAEDDERARRALIFLLQRHSFEVDGARDGREALSRLDADATPTILLLDWEMPELNGLQVCRAIREMARSAYTYIVMLTARDASADVLSAFEAGVDDFLTKPVDAGQLLARLRSGARVLHLEQRYAQRVTELETALHEVRQLKRLLPICMYCKRVRDDEDYWQEIEGYIHTHTGADFSHGICPHCFETVMADQMPKSPVERALRRRKIASS